MKKEALVLTLTAILTLYCETAKARFETYVLTATNQTHAVTIEPFETARVVTFRDYAGCASPLRIEKDGGAFLFCPSGIQGTPKAEDLVVRGPAVFTYRHQFTYFDGTKWGPDRNGTTPAILTLEIVPEAYPPDRALTLGPGLGAEITLQRSTNLLNWVSATNGVYTAPESTATFFRLKAEKVP